MARPSKLYSLRMNGDYVQFFVKGVYVGSKSLKELCLQVKGEKYDG